VLGGAFPEKADLLKYENQHDCAREGNQEARQAPRRLESQEPRYPVPDQPADDTDDHVRDDPHLRVGLHEDAREPPDDAANDQ